MTKNLKFSAVIALLLISIMILPTFAEDVNKINLFEDLPKVDASDLIKNDSANSIVTTKTDNGIFIEQSIDEIIKSRPDLKEKIYKILKEKSLLNKDGTIKKEQLKALQSSFGKESKDSTSIQTFLGTGTEYVYSGRYPTNGSTIADWTKQTVWQAINQTGQAQNFSVSNSYTQGCTVSSEVSINSTAGLSDALSMSAGCKLTYSISQSATQTYGATILVPAYTTRTITGKSFVICYSYYQNYYFLGGLVSHDLVGVFVPTGVQWTLT